MSGPIAFVIHQLVQLPNQTILNQWPEKIFFLRGSEWFFGEELFKNLMSSKWMKCFEGEIIVNGSFFLFRKRIVSLIDLNKLFRSLLIFRIFLWMIFQGQFSVCLFNFIMRRVSRDSNDMIIVFGLMRVVLLEEIFFLLIVNSKLIIETFKCLMSLINGKLSFDQLIVVGSHVLIAQDFVGFTDIFELFLGLQSFFLILLGMMVDCQLVVGLVNFSFSSIMADFQYGVVVLHFFGLAHLTEIIIL